MARPSYVPDVLRSVSDATRRDVLGFREMRTCGILKLEPEPIVAVCRSYAEMPPRELEAILASRTPSWIAHLMVGLGNYVYRGDDATSRIGMFVDTRPHIEACIRQDLEGVCDYHPWQTFAYAALAGVHPDIIIANSGATMRTIALNSRRIELPQSDPSELGHLLIAAGALVPDQTLPFQLHGERRQLRELIELALSVHWINDRRAVCSDFHLTEGLVIATTLVPGMSHIRAEVRELLDQQLLTLSIMGAFLSQLAALDPYVQRLYIEGHGSQRDRIAISIGHALELAALAQIYGFDLTTEQLNTVAFVANHSCRFSDIFQTAKFSTMAHLRRALTLLLEIEAAKAESRSPATVDFARYVVNLDSRME